MRALAVVVCAIVLLSPAVAGRQGEQALPFSAADADQFTRKVATIAMLGASAPAARRGPVRTTVTEPELNAFLHFRAQPFLPVGVLEPAVYAVGGGRLRGVATVDLDAVKNSKPRGWLDPMRLLRGRLPVTATGVLQTQNGVARFQLESAEVAGVPVPKTLLQELVGYYSRSDTHPDGYSLDEPFELPSRIREIAVEPGRAIIVQ